MNELLFVVPLLALCLAWKSPRVPGDPAGAAFVLSTEENRRDEVVMPGGGAPVPVDFETRMFLYGRIHREGTGDAYRFITENDSIRMVASSPLSFATFMSRDTLYYISEAGPKVVDRGSLAVYDSMLACLFEGRSLQIAPAVRQPAGSIPGFLVRDRKQDCPSGEYGRMNVPVTMGFFFLRSDLLPEKGGEWIETRTLPGGMGLRYYPSLRVGFRVVESTASRTTVVFRADTTFENVKHAPTAMDTVRILSDRIHVGGTIMIDPSMGWPARGEIRIDRELLYERPRAGRGAGRKESSFIVRLTVGNPSGRGDPDEKR